MATQVYPSLGYEVFSETRSGLHSFAMLLGSYNRVFAYAQKHWWHISLKPTVDGFTTGVLQSDSKLFELILNFRLLKVELHIEGMHVQEFSLAGESAASLQEKLEVVFSGVGIRTLPDQGKLDTHQYRIDQLQSVDIAHVYGRLAQCLARFRSEVSLETSPVQLWPHHFDLAMLVLTGRKIQGQDPENEEVSDEQLNIGFVSGDQGISEAYFYITFYPDEKRLEKVVLPEQAFFFNEGWNGIVMHYDLFRKSRQAENVLTGLLQSAYDAVKEDVK